MMRLVKECREKGLPFVFDPAHQLPRLSAEDVTEGARGAWILIGNDYELELIMQRTGRTMDGLMELAEIVVTTLGREGSRIATSAGVMDIPPARSTSAGTVSGKSIIKPRIGPISPIFLPERMPHPTTKVYEFRAARPGRRQLILNLFNK